MPGPLEALVGAWEGSEGLDVSFSHARGAIHETPFRERVTFDPLGPVDEGLLSVFEACFTGALVMAFDYVDSAGVASSRRI